MLTVDLGEDREEVSESGVGDELLRAGEAVAAALLGHRPRLGAEGVAARTGLGERVGREPLAGCQPRQIALLLGFRAVVDDRQGADPRVRAPRDAEGSVERAALGDQHGRRLPEAESPVALRDVDHQETELTGAPEECGHQPFLLRLDLFELRKDLVSNEVLGRLGVEEVVAGEVGTGELRSRPERSHEPARSTSRHQAARRPALADGHRPTVSAARAGAARSPTRSARERGDERRRRPTSRRCSRSRTRRSGRRS